MDTRLQSALSPNSRKVLEKRYLRKDAEGRVIETAEELFRRVAKNIASADLIYDSNADVKTLEDEFYAIISNLDFLPNSPTLMNAGRELQQLSACFVLPIEDAMESIFEAIKNTALIHRSGGGTGFSFSKLRPKNSMVKTTGGIASGPVSFMKVFDAATHAVKQGGCVIPSTRISTEKGLVKIEKLGPADAKSNTWHSYNPHPLSVFTDEGIKISNEFYNNGISPILTLTTRNCYTISTTPEHRLRVIDEKGNYVWRFVKDIEIGDWVALQKNTYVEGIEYKFPEFKEAAHFNAKKIILPSEPSEELGEFIGLIIGDGAISINSKGCGRLIISVEDKDTDVVEYLLKISEELFGLKPIRQKKLDDESTNYFFNSTILVSWLKHIGVEKSSASKARVSELVFQAGREFANGFLRGLFTADGTITKEGYPSLCSVSKNLIEEVQQLLLSLSIPSSVSVKRDRKNAFGKLPLYQLRIISNAGLKKFASEIGFISKQKNLRLQNGLTKAWEFNDVIPNVGFILETIYNGPGRGCGPRRSKRGANRKLYREIQHYLPGITASRHLTRLRLNKLVDKYEGLRNDSRVQWFLNNEQFYDQIVDIKEGESLTLDIAVPENSTYIANGFVSHNTRRGANMGILRIDHPDILEFITCKESDKEITNFNISVALTEEFMEKVQRDEEYDLIAPHTKKSVGRLKAREVFNTIVNMAWRNGEPGIIFIDRINKSNPTPKIGAIESTNPCIVGDSLVSTEHGLMRMKDIVKFFGEGGLQVATDDRVTEVLYSSKVNGNGNIAVKTKCGITFNSISKAIYSGRKPVLRLVTNSGFELLATADHKIMTTEGWVKMKDFKKGRHKVLIQSVEGKFNEDKNLPFVVINDFLGENGRRYKLNLPGRWSKELGQVLGCIVGDGWLREGDKNCRVGFTFSKEDRAILDYMKPIINNWYGYDVREVERENGVFHLSYHSKYLVEFFKSLGVKAWRSEEKEVPESIYTAPREAVIGFLQGLFTADGTVNYRKSNFSSYVRLTAKSLKLLKGVQLLLINLGIKSRIYDRTRNERYGFEYIAKNGQKRVYRLDGICWELEISRDAVMRFLEGIGFLGDKHKEKIEKFYEKNFYKTIFEEDIKCIEPYGEEEVYDLTENRSNSFISNGLCIKNCGEQPLLPYESCNLGSINLSKTVKRIDGKHEIDWEKLRKITHLAVHFLDNVIDLNKFPLRQIEEMTKANRKIGLGVMGFAEMLIKLGIPYNSEEAIHTAEKVMAFILEESKKESYALALRRGPFPNFSNSIYAGGSSLRNATLTTIAPTGTLSIIAGTSSGIEPLFAISYYREVMDKTKLVEVNPIFEEVAKERGFYSEKLMENIAEQGSIHSVEEIPEDVRRVFVTAHDIVPIWHVRMQAAFQKYTDNAVSKTVNFAHEATPEDVREVYLLAYKMECKGVTIYRDRSREEQVLYIARPKERSVEETNNNSEEKKETVKEEMVGERQEKARTSPRPRPEVTRGTTTKILTGCGNLYVTINEDEKGQPFEVFTQMGKAGGCAASQLEAIGRLVSLALRCGLDVRSIIEQLSSIRCPSPSWEKGGRIFSCADAIAKVIERRLLNRKAEEQKELKTEEAPPQNKVKAGNVVGVCPDCSGALYHEEGCMVCKACGYSKCG